MFGSVARSRLSPRVTMGVLVAVVLIALVAFAGVLVSSERSARGDLEERFSDRGVASAELIASLFESASGTAQMANAERYGGAEVSADALARRANDADNRYLLVLDASGEVLGGSPGVTPRVRRMLAARPPYIRAALAGRVFTLSGVESGEDGRPEFVYSQTFETSFGRRVLVAGLDGRLIGAFIAGSLRRLPRVRDARIFVVDASGTVVASPSRALRVGQRVDDAPLLAALRRSRSGRIGDRHFTSHPIAGTPWRVVRTAPNSSLFASVSGLNRWGPWALFAAFAISALAGLALGRRILRSAVALDAANARLASTNATLAVRARELADVNDALEWTNTELGRSNTELEHYASIASHDLQEPLRKIQMFAERLTYHDAENLSERSRDYLARMSGAAGRMQDLIDGLLSYSRLARQEGPRADVELDVLARDVVGDLRLAITDAGGRVELGSLPSVAADPVQMRQLLQNLIANGLKFRREDVAPVVRVEGTSDEDTVTVSVSDNGIGIESRFADRIFEVFERLHPRTAYEGTGVGLAVCRRIAERHGGAISFTSVPGEGSTFTVTLPRHATLVAATPPHQQRDPRAVTP